MPNQRMLKRLGKILTESDIVLPQQWANLSGVTSFADLLDKLQELNAWWNSDHPAVNDFQRRRISAREFKGFRDLDRDLRCNNFIIVGELGTGGMGTVHKAWSTDFEQFVGIKRLSNNDHVLRDRLNREAKILRMLDDPMIAQFVAHEPVEDGDGFLLAMEYVKGETLRDHMRTHGRLSLDKARDWTIAVIQALNHAHKRNVIHRDVTPRNIMVNQDSSEQPVKLLDFGLGKITGALSVALKVPEITGDLTLTGQALGTPQYMSPELWSDAANVGEASDFYSVGCNFFEMLTGQTPFDGPYAAQCIKHTNEQPPDIRTIRPDVPANMRHALRQMLTKSPTARGSADDLIGLLRGEERVLQVKTASKTLKSKTDPSLNRWQESRLNRNSNAPNKKITNRNSRNSKLEVLTGPSATSWKRRLIPPSRLTASAECVDNQITSTDVYVWVVRPVSIATALVVVLAVCYVTMLLFKSS